MKHGELSRSVCTENMGASASVSLCVSEATCSRWMLFYYIVRCFRDDCTIDYTLCTVVSPANISYEGQSTSVTVVLSSNSTIKQSFLCYNIHSALEALTYLTLVSLLVEFLDVSVFFIQEICHCVPAGCIILLLSS